MVDDAEELFLRLNVHEHSVRVDGGRSFERHLLSIRQVAFDLVDIPSFLDAGGEPIGIETDCFPDRQPLLFRDQKSFLLIFQRIHLFREFPVFLLLMGAQSGKSIFFRIQMTVERKILIGDSDLPGESIVLHEFLPHELVESDARRTLEIAVFDDLHFRLRIPIERAFDVGLLEGFGGFRVEDIPPLAARGEKKSTGYENQESFHGVGFNVRIIFLLSQK